MDPVKKFESIPIDIRSGNPFHMIVLPMRLWYQPINSGEADLSYFMIHEPAFEMSEMLVLERENCAH